MNLLEQLLEEKSTHRKGGLYHQTQILFAYNSNRIEGSRLTHEQTRFIYETNTFLPDGDTPIRTDDVIETINHFQAFDYMLDVAGQPLSEEVIKELHRLLKRGTSDERDPRFRVGEYKALPNMIGEMVYTAAPKEVPAKMQELLRAYREKPSVNEQDVIDFHYRFEAIHPFQDGNGRVGRLVMFKECLAHGLVPFVIDSDHKLFYYRGLREYPQEPGYLVDTCLSAQDKYRQLIAYFQQPPLEP